MTEETTPYPEDPYGIAKLAVEQERRICKEMFGVDYIIFRPKMYMASGKTLVINIVM
jgi:UDP-glucose 4-epimerase